MKKEKHHKENTELPDTFKNIVSFKAPNGYFESLPDNLLDRVTFPETKTEKSAGHLFDAFFTYLSIHRLSFGLGSLAIALLTTTGLHFFGNKITDSNPSLTLETEPITEELISYLTRHPYSIDEDVLLEIATHELSENDLLEIVWEEKDRQLLKKETEQLLEENYLRDIL